jgi:hypothetical protein
MEDMAKLIEPTIRKDEILLSSNYELDYFTIICAERSSTRVVATALQHGVTNMDFLVGPENEGDTDYSGIEQAIQEGYWTPNTWSWDWGIRDLFFPNYIDTGVIKAGAPLLASDGAFGGTGIFQLKEPPEPMEIYYGPKASCTPYQGDCEYKLVKLPGRYTGPNITRRRKHHFTDGSGR